MDSIELHGCDLLPLVLKQCVISKVSMGMPQE